MKKKNERRLYRVLFQNQGKLFEVYARTVVQGGLFGFIEIEDLVFGEKSTILVDPNEDSLRKEFEGAKRIYVPLHSVVRVDEMERDSQARSRVIPMPGTETTAPEGRLTPIYTPRPAPEA